MAANESEQGTSVEEATQTGAERAPEVGDEREWVVLHTAADAEAAARDVLPLFPAGRARSVVVEESAALEPGEATVVAWLDDAALRVLWRRAVDGDWRIGVLPHPGSGRARAGLGLDPDVAEAVRDLVEAPREVRMDVLTCNGHVVFESVVVGDTSVLEPVPSPGATPAMRARALLRRSAGLRSVRLRALELTTRAEKRIETAALGIVVVEHGASSGLTRALLADAGHDDGQLAALVLAPRSVVELAVFLARSAFDPRSRGDRLPPFAGLIRSASLTVESREPLEFWLDGARAAAEKLELDVEPRALRVLAGRHLELPSRGAATKERFRTGALPTGESRTELLRGPLPLLPHASTEDFKDLYQVLRTNAEPGASYLVLMVLSTLLATFGLFADSAPVIIGAMILAPLMSPIVSLAMGVARQDARLVPRALGTLGLGLALAVGCGTVLTWMTPLETVTSEIAARLRPTLLDLGIAVISGIAAAYAHAREEIAKSLAGVAIAVALVPPLAVMGVGVGWGSWEILSGSGLLFLTNLAGIVLAASLTFLALGFAPFRLARRGIAFSLVFVVAVGVPLGLAFGRMVEAHGIVRALDGLEVEGASLDSVTVVRDAPLTVAAQVLLRGPLDDSVFDAVERAVEERLGRPVELELTPRFAR